MKRVVSVFLLALLGAGIVVAPVAAQERPQRIVSLSATATEMLFAIGAGGQVEAVDDRSTYPKRAPRTDLSGFEPNVEAIAGYRPDLVVISEDVITDQVEALGIDVLVLPAATRLKETYQQIRGLGRVTGHQQQADQLVSEMKADIRDLTGRVPEGEKASAYYELDDTYFSADSTTFIGRLLALGGFESIADAAPGDGSGYPQLSAEYVVDADPETIFLADTKCCGQSFETVSQRPGFEGVKAVRDGNVVELDDDIASRWGPRVVDLLRTIVKERTQL
jgi:iron complex transport system substrate-binding protein